MIEQLVDLEAELSAADVLRELRSDQRHIWALEARQLRLAAHWADLHPAESIYSAAAFDNIEVGGSYSEREEPLAGPGLPGVAEFCVAELGAMLGLTTVSAKRLIGNAQELRHRLPKTWARIQTGTVAPWKARRIAETTSHAHPALTPEAMRYIDGQLTCRTDLMGPIAIQNLIDDTIRRFHLLPALECDYEGSPIENAFDTHFVDIDEQRVNSDGTMLVTAHLDLADALDLKHAVEQGAQALAAQGCEESLGYRRAKALGALARALNGGNTIGPGRQLHLNVHLTALHDSRGIGLDPIVHLDQSQQSVLLHQVQSWCADTNTTVRIQPVIDLNADLTAPGYRPTTRQYQQIQLRDRTCVFPYCGRPATACDLDHVEPFDADKPAAEQTRSANLGALCRRHHRLKTFGRWRVSSPSPGTFIWTSPHGYHFIRRPDGTTKPGD